MADFCIPKEQVEKISKAISETNIADIFAMSKKDRIAFFRKNSSDEIAEKISNSFDDIIVEAKRDSLEKAFKSLGVKDEQLRKELYREIRKMSNADLLDPAKEDALIDKITGYATGVKITQEETKKIVEIGTKIEQYKSIVDTTKPIENGTFNKKYGDAFKNMAIYQDEMNKFISSKIPVSKTETFWSHAKASMLAKPASWLVNIISNTENAGLEAISRRIGSGRMGGYNSEITKEWKKVMAEIYKKTGNDYSRALSLDELVTGNGKALGEISTQGKETWLTNFIYKGALGTPDAWSARMNFADAANLYSSKIADELGLAGKEAKSKAAEILGDALNVLPRTEDGKIVREMAVADALRATYTNESVSSKFSMTIKNAINSIPGLRTVRVGDLLEPFVKTPANVIEQGLDISGLGFLKGTYKTAKYFQQKAIDPVKARGYLMEALKDGSKAGVGLLTAFGVSTLIDKDNFMGAYDPARAKWEQLRNSNYNAIKIGDKWISLDYIGPLATPLVSILSAKKYGEGGFLDRTGAYLKGTLSQTSKIPFITTGWEAIEGFKQATDVEKKKFLPAIQELFMEQVASRIPGIFSDIAKISDKQLRDVTTGKFGKWGFNPDPIVSKIPWVSKFLPEKRNMLGEDIKTEAYSKEDKFAIGFLTTLLTGARVKTEQESPEAREVYRLYKTDNAPTITNWKYVRSPKLERLKEKVGAEKYNQIFIEEYGPKYKEGISKLLNSSSYKNATDEDKKIKIDNEEDKVMEKIYSKYGIRNK